MNFDDDALGDASTRLGDGDIISNRLGSNPYSTYLEGQTDYVPFARRRPRAAPNGLSVHPVNYGKIRNEDNCDIDDGFDYAMAKSKKKDAKQQPSPYGELDSLLGEKQGVDRSSTLSTTTTTSVKRSEPVETSTSTTSTSTSIPAFPPSLNSPRLSVKERTKFVFDAKVRQDLLVSHVIDTIPAEPVLSMISKSAKMAGTPKHPKVYVDNSKSIVTLGREDQEAVLASKLMHFYEFFPVRKHDKKKDLGILEKHWGNNHFPSLSGFGNLDNSVVKNAIRAQAMNSGYTREAFSEANKNAGPYHHPAKYSTFAIKALAKGCPGFAKTICELSSVRKGMRPSQAYLKGEKAIGLSKAAITKGFRAAAVEIYLRDYKGEEDAVEDSTGGLFADGSNSFQREALEMKMEIDRMDAEMDVFARGRSGGGVRSGGARRKRRNFATIPSALPPSARPAAPIRRRLGIHNFIPLTPFRKPRSKAKPVQQTQPRTQVVGSARIVGVANPSAFKPKVNLVAEKNATRTYTVELPDILMFAGSLVINGCNVILPVTVNYRTMGNVGVYDEQGKKDFLQDAGIDPLLSEPFESRHVVFRPSPHHRVMEAGCVYDVDKWGRTGSKNRLRVNVQLTRLRSKAPEKVHISSNVGGYAFPIPSKLQQQGGMIILNDNTEPKNVGGYSHSKPKPPQPEKPVVAIDKDETLSQQESAPSLEKSVRMNRGAEDPPSFVKERAIPWKKSSVSMAKYLDSPAVASMLPATEIERTLAIFSPQTEKPAVEFEDPHEILGLPLIIADEGRPNPEIVDDVDEFLSIGSNKTKYKRTERKAWDAEFWIAYVVFCDSKEVRVYYAGISNLIRYTIGKWRKHVRVGNVYSLKWLWENAKRKE